MKKFKLILIILLSFYLLTGCNSIAVNEIHNKSYNVGEISIQEFEDLVVAAIDKVSHAVVGVSNYQGVLGFGKIAGTGSGVIYQCTATMKDGTTVSDCSTTLDSIGEVEHYNYLVVTNRHVIEDSDVIKIYLGEEDLKVNARLIQFDDKVDLAVVSFDHYNYIQPIEFADSDQLKRGTFAIAIGNPSGYEFFGSSTFGIISNSKIYLADDTDGDDTTDWDAEYIQHDVAINPGNSGGALINLEGKLIGINTLKMLSDEIDNMGFAIPSNVVSEIVNILETGAKPARNTLGITIIPVKTILNPEDYQDDQLSKYQVPENIKTGLYVVSVEESRPATNKLYPGDIILKVNSIDINYSYEFRAEINKILVGQTGVFRVYRNNQEIDINITF